MRQIDDILNMLDLYYRYHWACIEYQINPQTPIGNLIPSAVLERRRGLEWLVSQVDDWNEVALHT